MTPVKVRQPDGLGEPLVHQLLHGLPGLEVVAVHVRAVEALVSQREHGVLAVMCGETSVRAESADLSCREKIRKQLWVKHHHSITPVLGTACGQWITNESM